ncbi:unnamed protein product [Cylindrotheca closterium]|uniref:PPIase cyclophilin-type domain-containing protein n=1 Tax=Cylindrotheca closterium TaxID=2856 RepID=A0AAD2JHH4_9STRA|nr:unnamed protein product [Cylindrotheca closterium]
MKPRVKQSGISIATVLKILFVCLALVWIGTSILFFRQHFKSSSDDPTHHHSPIRQEQQHFGIILDFPTVNTGNVTIRIQVFHKECPEAWKFVQWMTGNQRVECIACTIYRGEPVPFYWGSPEYPDRYFNGGRWGPPYALVQGGFVNHRLVHIERENHKPNPVKRGMVAWAGDKGIHFFMALADHPEWGNAHTVWGQVHEKDMASLDALVQKEPLHILEKNNPVLSNFLSPMPFHISRLTEQEWTAHNEARE